MNVTEVLAQAVERHHPRLVMLCSFQKEESVLVDELVRLAPDARIVTIDTGVLFPETLATWRAFEQRFGVDIAIEDATGDWTGPRTAAASARSPRWSARSGGVDAWITGIRREQSPTRADAQPVEWDDKRGIWKFNPLVRVDREGPLAAHPRARPAVPPAARPGLLVDRLRALHQPRLRPRGPLGGPVQDRVRAARMTAITQPALSHLRALEAEAIHVMREVAAEREKPALLFSGGKDSIVLVRLAQKAFAPGKVPFPLLHIDTGHNFPEVIEFRDRLVRRERPRPARRLRPGVDRRRPRARGDRPARVAQPAADGDAAGRDRGATSSTPASAAPAATRSAPAPRSACSPSATTSARGTRAASAPSCGTSTTRACAAARTSARSRSPTGPSSTSGSTSRPRSSSCRTIYMAHEREVFARDGMLYAVSAVHHADGG